MESQNRLFKEENYSSMEEKLFYSLLYRSFNDAVEIISNNLSSDYLDIKFEGFNIRDVIEWNYDYFEEYDNLSNNKIKLKEWSDEILKGKTIYSSFSYDEIITEDGKSIFDTFFKKQPLLNVREVKGQDLPSKQILENNMSLVLDEVGSGKSVSALYAMADIIDDKDVAHILIVCPSQLREKWQNDIRRQLGRYSHIVSRGDSNEQYKDCLKEIYFRNKEECIFIIDNIDIAKKENFKKWSSNQYSYQKWDLVIVDECHLCTANYRGVKSEKVMMLTATPIVVSSNKKIELNSYKEIMEGIIDKSNEKNIQPLKIRNTTTKEIFTNRFREDSGPAPCKRSIRFEICKRADKWFAFYRAIANHKGTLTALHYAQDDEYLYRSYNNEMNEDCEIPKLNGKLIMLKYIIGLNISEDESNYIGKENNKQNEKKSYIVFCDHREVVDMIYEQLKNSNENLVVAKKYGEIEYFDEGKCEKGSLISQLHQSIKEKKQTILITTGQTGGTGLNLGDFDGVIHYELPFTSIQLEQRYGRVDRLDRSNSKDKKEMIFLLNKCEEGEFFKHNKMLYYCVTKIDETCRHLPIRNTVIYHPSMASKVVDSIKSDLVRIGQYDVFKSDCYREIKAQLKLYKEDIEKEAKKAEVEYDEFLEECIKNKDVIQKENLKNAINNYMNNMEMIKSYDLQISEYKEVKKVALRLFSLFGDSKAINDIFIMKDVTEEEKAEENHVLGEDSDEKRDIRNEESESSSDDKYSQGINWVDDFKLVLHQLNNLSESEMNKFENELANGIFYFEKDKVERSDVDSFRKSDGGN